MNLSGKASPSGVWIIGHRGAMGHAPENTMASFEEGRKLGADCVECDVHLSRDGRCIVIHDATLERTTDGRGAVKDLTAKEIRKFDAGSRFSRKFKGERVPLLDELLGWAKRQKTAAGRPLGVVIEIKSEKVKYPGIEREVVHSVKRAGMSGRVVAISFNHRSVAAIKKLAPSISTGILFAKPLRNPFLAARKAGADSLFPLKNLATRKLVREAHKRDLTVSTWTANAPREMRALIAAGVDALATNFPERLRRLL